MFNKGGIISPIVSHVPNFVLLSIPLLLPAFVTTKASSHVQKEFMIISLIGVAGCIVTNYLIPILARYTVKKFFGRDINKKGTKEGEIKIPESLGIACGIVYLACGVIGQFWYFNEPTKVMFKNDFIFIYSQNIIIVCYFFIKFILIKIVVS